MAITVASVIGRARRILQDTTSVRWPEDELLEWLGDGQLEVVKLMPSAGVVTANLALDPTDTLQRLPSSAIQFLRCIRNVGGRSIRQVDRSILDSQLPDWYNTQGTEAKHYVHDPIDPKVFYVYPMVTTPGAEVEVVYSEAPASPTAGGNLSIPDIYATAVLDYILYRAYSKDAEATANMQLADAHLKRFVEGIGLKVQADQLAMAVSSVERAGPIVGS